MKKLTLVIACALLFSAQAIATTAPITLPEPSILNLFAVGVAVAAIVSRLIDRK